MIGRALPTPDARLKPPPKLADPFYLSAQWRDFAKDIKRQRGYRCQDTACAKPDMSKTPWLLIADHVIERRDGGADYDPLNVLLRCQACHNRKTAKARAARASAGREGGAKSSPPR
jgi:5-methylcytosine-specific restriction endonuclease McrA